MSKSVLFLGLAPLQARQSLAHTPPRVYFAVFSGSHDAPMAFDVDAPYWRVRESDGDFRETNELFNQLQDACVAGKTLLEFVWYDGVSMWQFLPSWLWPAVFRTVELIDTVTEIVDETKPQKIVAFPVADYTHPIWQGVLQAIGEVRGIPVEIVRPDVLWKLRQQLRFWLSRTHVGNTVLHLYRMVWPPDRAVQWAASILSSLVYSRVSKREESAGDDSVGKKVLCVTLGKRHWVSVPGDSDRKYDEQFYPLLPALRAAGWTRFVMVDCQDLPDSELQARMHSGEADVCWRRYSSYRRQGDKTAAKARSTFARMWQVLKNDTQFAQHFRYRGVNLMPALQQELHWAFHVLLPKCAELLATAGQMLVEEHPDAVIATYETGPWARALIIQAGRAGIPTVGLQHGIIFDNHYDYMHRRITTDPVANPIGFVVPKITCVWGPFSKENLTKTGNYPDEAVVVTGNWRYDCLLEIAGGMNIARLKQKFGIPPGKKVVLILSSSQSYIDYIRQCLQVLVTRPECTPLIKLHPDDNPVPVYKMLRQFGYPYNVLIQRQLIETLMVADLVISQISTAVSEAALLGKEIVLVNFQNLKGCEPYVRSGICLYVTDPAELASAIEQGLNSPPLQAKMRAARNDFIPRFFFNTDGCAAQRVAGVLERLYAHKSWKKADNAA